MRAVPGPGSAPRPRRPHRDTQVRAVGTFHQSGLDRSRARRVGDRVDPGVHPGAYTGDHAAAHPTRTATPVPGATAGGPGWAGQQTLEESEQRASRAP
jgi:hypothetical protein